ncbi:MAG: aminoacyl--tRNA ligase-related protein, partial [Candidatus Aenigmatarchaeota archaeon]
IISEKIKREYLILTPEGEEYSIDMSDREKIEKILSKVKSQELRTYVINVELGMMPKREPPSIKAMQQQELVGYAPEADSGHFKFYPKGNLIFELIKDWCDEIALKRLGCMQIDTPIMYNWADPEIREQGGSFHERHYTVKCPDEPEKELVMRFAGDFGLFKIMKNAKFSYKNLPLRIYEFSKSFRYEQAGELSGLKRLRAFHMPDIHSFTSDIESGWQEYKELYKNYDDLTKGLGIRYAIAFRIVKEFYEKYKDQIVEMLKYSGMPAFIEILSEMKHYWAVKHEFQGLDSVGGSTQLATVQLDVKDSETYGITYTDKDGKQKGCIIVHSSIGSIERLLYCILENAFTLPKKMLPYWLCPTQLRIAPLSEKYLEESTNLAKRLNAYGIRTDIDDRNETIQKKVLQAENEWIRYLIVYGEKEMKEKLYSVRVREDGKIIKLSEEELKNRLLKEQGKMPWRPLPLPMHLSKRPIFYG